MKAVDNGERFAAVLRRKQLLERAEIIAARLADDEGMLDEVSIESEEREHRRSLYRELFAAFEELRR
jgi:hypothetical protein